MSQNAAVRPILHHTCASFPSQVKLLNGHTRLVQQLKKGDILPCGGVVRCVVRTDCLNGKASLVKLTSLESTGPGSVLDSLYVTAWHPVEIGGQWVFPGTVRVPVIVECEAVYSFLVSRSNTNAAGGRNNVCDEEREGERRGQREGENSHVGSDKQEEFSSSITVNGIKCVTLAHGIKGSEVLSHPFYGTVEVVNALKKCRGWKAGLVRFGAAATSSQQRHTHPTEEVQCDNIAGRIENGRKTNISRSEDIQILSSNHPDTQPSLDGYPVEYGRDGTVLDFVVRDSHTGLVNGFMLSSEM